MWQALVLAAVAALVAWLVLNTLHNLQARNIASGFGFLSREAGFAVSESPIAYAPTDSYARVLWVGVLNTLRVSAAGIVLATLLGTVLGLLRLSSNKPAAGLAATYVEVMRNIPLLLHLFFWYSIITETLPAPRQALNPLPGIFISNRGINLPWFDVGTSGGWSVPVLHGFNFTGGITLTPEFAALLLGLVLYTSAFVSEVVRSGIKAVGQGQWAAGRALGLREPQVLRLVVLPQALRVMVPPMTSQYLNLTKNSSLAVAIGYPDIVSVANTMLNQTGQAIEGVLVIMAAYLTVSLTISVLMNAYNRRIALVER